MNSTRTGLVPITAALADGGTPTTSVPGYDRSQVTAGIAHIGVGNFHRVHQGVYLDDLLAARTDHTSGASSALGCAIRTLPRPRPTPTRSRTACTPSPSTRMTVDRPRALSARWSSTSMGPLIRRLPSQD